MVGSPPLARERRRDIINHLLRPRITPAYAGKTIPLIKDFVGGWDHPRLRGKDSTFSVINSITLGSPPLTRERLPRAIILIMWHRITPAHAGKTANINIFLFHVQDHPRSRGKDMLMAGHWQNLRGSPPLTRERHLAVSHLTTITGITPADAGKTYHSLSKPLFNRDHPR